MEFKTISFVGLGLIGSSIARALKKNFPDLTIYAVEQNFSSIEQATSDGVINRGALEPFGEFWDCDLLFLCIPVKAAKHYIDIAANSINKNAIVTDVLSTKNEICTYIQELPHFPQFVGGHPMAGTEKSGYANGFAHMFENAYYALTPIASTSKETINKVEALVKQIGAIPLIIEPEQHDLVTGCISHLPHVIASGLVNLTNKRETSNGLMQLMAAGGFKDITRIASSNPSMWENIVVSNRGMLMDLLDSFSNILSDFRSRLDESNSEYIRDYFTSAKVFRDGLSQAPKSLLPKTFELVVDVSDEPGIIGKIATLLGDNGINIKNINVSNSREFELGCLKLTLPDEYNTQLAFKVLNHSSYKVYKTE